MWSRSCLFILLITFLSHCGSDIAAANEANSPQEPNVVIIYIDDMGWKDLGCYGSTFYETPNIDRLRAEGMAFTDAYSACNVCSPSRHALLTGKYPARSHFTNVAKWPLDPDRPLSDPIQDDVLNNAEVTLAEVFQSAGYHTGFFGKWHMLDEGDSPTEGGRHGFDIWNQMATEGGWKPPVIMEEQDDPKEVREMTEKSIGFVRSAISAGKPFLLYMAHHTVHVELQTTPDLHAKYRRKTPGENGQNNPYMGGMIEYLDTEMGRFLETLEELGVTKDTFVIFTSDNGGQSEQFGTLVTSQSPLRGGKGDETEGGTRVPFIVAGPGIKPGTTSAIPTMQIDLYPTLLDLARLPANPSQTLDGFSLTPMLWNQPGPTAPITQREAIYWHYPHYKSSTEPYSAVRKGNWKLIVWMEEELSPFGGPGKELYNLRTDIGEEHNLRDRRPDKVAELYADLQQHRREMDAQMPTVNQDYKPSSAP